MKKLVALFALLLTLACCTTEADRTRMRAGLDSINQRNRNDQPFTVQDVEPYVQFFDHHGTSNDRLLAHYLLGRAYHEQGEAPMALECYQKAAECADTTSKDCDYRQLCRVYGQMSGLFHDQGLYRQGLSYDKVSEYYAIKAKDTLCYLMTYEQESFAYRKMGMADSALSVIENVYSKYLQLGYTSDAAIALGAILRVVLENGEYQKLKRYMDFYESKSGLFDVAGNIESGREIYYNIKGYYYLRTGKADSAMYFFRKELRDGKDFNNQNAAAMGLAQLFQNQHRQDSATKYAIYAYAMNDSMYAQQATESVERIQSLYTYSYHQKIAREEREKAQQRIIIIWLCIGIIVVSSLLVYIFIGYLIRKRKNAEQLYNQSLFAIEQAQRDISKLNLSDAINKSLISEKEQIIRRRGDFPWIAHTATPIA